MSVRELSLDDYGAFSALAGRNDFHERPEAEWRRFWTEHPWQEEYRLVPPGWGLFEGGGQLVGVLFNIPAPYVFGGERLRGATGRAWLADPPHRAASVALALRFFSQPHVDLVISSTASANAGKVYEALRAVRMPRSEFTEIFMWITHYPAFARAVLRKKGVPAAWLSCYPAAAALWAGDRLRRFPRPSPAAGEVEVAREFDARFDSLWDELQRRSDRLTAVRDRAALAWHFGYSSRKGELRVVTLERGGLLRGYAVLVRADREQLGLSRYRLADLQAVDDDQESAAALALAGLELARREGVAVVESTGFAPLKRGALAGIPHRRRRLDGWPFYYYTRRADIAERLADPATWDPSLYDGDTTL